MPAELLSNSAANKAEEALGKIFASSNQLATLKEELANVPKKVTAREYKLLLRQVNREKDPDLKVEGYDALNQLTWLCLPQIYRVVSKHQNAGIEIEDTIAQMVLITQETIFNIKVGSKKPNIRTQVFSEGNKYFQQTENHKIEQPIISTGLVNAKEPEQLLHPGQIEDRIWLADMTKPESGVKPSLTDKELWAIQQIYGDSEKSLREIGREIGITGSRVDQLHTNALIKLRKHLPPGEGEKDRINETSLKTEPDEPEETVNPQSTKSRPARENRYEPTTSPPENQPFWKQIYLLQYLSATTRGENYLHLKYEFPKLIEFGDDLTGLLKDVIQNHRTAWLFAELNSNNFRSFYSQRPNDDEIRRVGSIHFDRQREIMNHVGLADSKLYFHPTHLYPLIFGEQNFVGLVNQNESLFAFRTRKTPSGPPVVQRLEADWRKFYGTINTFFLSEPTLSRLFFSNYAEIEDFRHFHMLQNLELACYRGSHSQSGVMSLMLSQEI